VCNKYFAAKDKRRRFYPNSCKIEYDNKESKFRIQRWRAKHTKNNQEKDENRQYEQKVKRFSEFLSFAMLHSQDIENIGKHVVKLGQGDGLKGWKIIKDCYNKLNNGISRYQVFNDLTQADKNLFSDN